MCSQLNREPLLYFITWKTAVKDKDATAVGSVAAALRSRTAVDRPPPKRPVPLVTKQAFNNYLSYIHI